MEHRWGVRRPINIAVRLTAGRLTMLDARLANLSMSGALIRGSCVVRVVSQLEVLILTCGAVHAMSLPAYVTRRCIDGIGIEWCEFAPRVVRELLRVSGSEWPGMERLQRIPRRDGFETGTERNIRSAVPSPPAAGEFPAIQSR
jgi:hypothetical protein